MCFVDLFGEKVGFGEGNGCDVRVIGVVGHATQAIRLHNRTESLKKTLVIAKVIRVDLKEVAYDRQTFGAIGIADSASINGDSH